MLYMWYADLNFRYIAHLWRRSKRRLMKKYRIWRYTREHNKEIKLNSKTESATLPLQHFPSSVEGMSMRI